MLYVHGFVFFHWHRIDFTCVACFTLSPVLLFREMLGDGAYRTRVDSCRIFQPGAEMSAARSRSILSPFLL